ncbi:hypothetical protein, partial [Burkholderia stagnalis]|uniref:hypothetical protein n=1 Tax=Burkholderia stagnalis TaxID=1503054 RepID=UPI001C2EC589
QARKGLGRRRNGVRDVIDPARDGARAPRDRAGLPCRTGGPAHSAADHACRATDAAQQSSDEFIVVCRVEAIGQLFFECVPERHVVDVVTFVERCRIRVVLQRVDGEVVAFVELLVAERIVGALFVEVLERARLVAQVGFVRHVAIEWFVHCLSPRSIRNSRNAGMRRRRRTADRQR